MGQNQRLWRHRNALLREQGCEIGLSCVANEMEKEADCIDTDKDGAAGDGNAHVLCMKLDRAPLRMHGMAMM